MCPSCWTGFGADHVIVKGAKRSFTRYNIQGDEVSWTRCWGKRNQCTYLTLCDSVYMSRASQENIAYMRRGSYMWVLSGPIQLRAYQTEVENHQKCLRIYEHNNKAVYVVHDSDIMHAIHVHIGAYVVCWFVILARGEN